jgi:hypothetical protein
MLIGNQALRRCCSGWCRGYYVLLQPGMSSDSSCVRVLTASPINNSYGCQNSYTLNYLLKNELDFQGFGTIF